jgi:hypothetical protein
LEHTAGSVDTYSNEKLARIAFPSLRQAPALTVTGNPELLSLDLNQVLRDLAALRQLTVLGELWLVDLPVLPSLAGLGMLTHVDAVRLEELEALSDLRGLDALADVRRLSIVGNSELASLAGLGALVSAQESLTVKYNSALADMSLPKLASVKVLSYQGTAPASTLSLPALRTCGSLEVVGNSTLATLTLPALASANTAFGEMLR